MRDTREDLDWLLHRILSNGNWGIVRDGDEDDAKLRQLEAAGVVRCYDAMFGNRYFALTDLGKGCFTISPEAPA